MIRRTFVPAVLLVAAALAVAGCGGSKKSATATVAPASTPTTSSSSATGDLAILNYALTLEYLETRGVPVVGCGTDELPGFFARESGLPAPMSVGTPAEAAALARRHWGLGLATGLVFAVPVPEAAALSREEADGAIERALAEADAAGIHGPAATPWVLRRVGELTDGRSIEANVALIEHNAEVAARIAVALAAL